MNVNLRVLRRTRRKPEVGDIFVMLPPDDLFLYGRVIKTDTPVIPGFRALLLYVYRDRSATKTPIPRLDPANLLLPPLLTNTLLWSRGYAEHLENRPLTPEDCLPRHCFKRYSREGICVDEQGIRVFGPVEPIGQWGLGSFRTIDDEISRALGIPMAPEDDTP